MKKRLMIALFTLSVSSVMTSYADSCPDPNTIKLPNNAPAGWTLFINNALFQIANRINVPNEDRFISAKQEGYAFKFGVYFLPNSSRFPKRVFCIYEAAPNYHYFNQPSDFILMSSANYQQPNDSISAWNTLTQPSINNTLRCYAPDHEVNNCPIYLSE